MTLLAAGVSPQDFTGPGGTGSPTYISAVAPTYGTWGRANIVLTSGTVLPSGLGFSCLYSTWAKSVNTFTLSAYMQYGARSAFAVPPASTPYRLGMVIYAANGHALMFIPSGAANTYDLALTTDVTSWAAYQYLGISFTVTNTWFTAGITVRGGGTTSGEILLELADSTGTVTSQNTWKGDLTDYHDFYASSCHDPCSGGSATCLGSLIVSEDHVFPALVFQYIPKTLGTLNEWPVSTGWATAFDTFPQTSTTYTDGLYSLTAGQRQTFAASTALYSTPPTGYILKTVAVSATHFVVDESDEKTLQPIIYDPSDATVTAFGDPIASSETQSQSWLAMDKDPKTGLHWSSSDLTRYQFGLERVK